MLTTNQFRQRQQNEAFNPHGARLRPVHWIPKTIHLTSGIPEEVQLEKLRRKDTTTIFPTGPRLLPENAYILGHNPRYMNVVPAEDITKFIGTRLGSGNFRTVYSHTGSPYLVIKEDNSNEFTNVAEYKIWEGMVRKHYDIAYQWLAPYYAISKDGRYALQRKVEVLDSLDDVPDEIPSFIDDLDAENWGKLDGKVVCHDYALHTYYKNPVRFRNISSDRKNYLGRENSHVFFHD